jgi:hypothetical protein
MAFEIGYRRPPPEHQFRKGVSGNPRGRPKESTNLVTLLQKELKAPIQITENGRLRSTTPRYIDVAIARWQRVTGKTAVHAESGLDWETLGGQRRNAALLGDAK